MALYKAAAGILKNLEDKNGSIKSLAIESKYKNTKQLYALTVEALKYKSVLLEIITKTKILQQESSISKHEAIVLIYDYLLGKGLQCGGRYKKLVYSRKSQLKSALALIKVKRKVSTNKDLIEQSVQDSLSLPKYLRINTLLTSKADVIDYFQKLGFTKAHSNCVQSLRKTDFMEDADVENLLVFHPSTDLHDDTLYKRGEIIFQDKASCLPAMILSPPPGSVVIDACAAPGNKTSHLAAIMKNRGTIHAFDINSRRASTMETLLLKAGVLCCHTKVQDFLQVNPACQDYKNVQYILLDPSCSGSGIVSRLDSLTDDTTSERVTRLQSLAKFQLTALSHALSFPSAQKVCYSTCSIHTIENEEVVRDALKLNPEFELVYILPAWKQRGHMVKNFSHMEANKCIRCDPASSLTNGFFVALFRRITK